MKKLKQEIKGVTLIALVITIIVMLILVGITINLAVEGGLFSYAEKAKVDIGLEREKEIITIAAMQAQVENRYGRIEAGDLEKKLKNELQNEDIEISESGNKIYVEFKENGRVYEIDEKGKIDTFIPYEDETPGQLAQDEDGNYMIESIEDLVVFSAMVNAGYSDDNLYIESNQFVDKTVVLMTNLDFKSKWSYEDSTTTIYNGYLGIEDTEVPLIEALTDIDKYKGFIPIGKESGFKCFKGSFDGNNYSIDNLSVNIETHAGLFGYSNGNITIKNITVTGTIKTTSSSGGILGKHDDGGLCIENCVNKAQVIGGDAGGIIGFYGNYNVGGLVIKNCYNEGNVQGNGCAGGILGSCKNYEEASDTEIINCYNNGDVTRTVMRGGLLDMLEKDIY